jgi:hypothetical protein
MVRQFGVYLGDRSGTQPRADIERRQGARLWDNFADRRDSVTVADLFV